MQSLRQESLYKAPAERQATLLVASQNFSGTDTLPFVLVGVVLMLLILLPVAKRMGARSEAASEAPAA